MRYKAKRRPKMPPSALWLKISADKEYSNQKVTELTFFPSPRVSYLPSKLQVHVNQPGSNP